MAFSLNADKLLESSLGLDEVGIGQLRSVEWSRKYLWSFNFLGIASNIPGLDQIKGEPTPKKPFDKFFPCVDIDETQQILETFSAEAYGTTLRLPQKGGVPTLRITFMDDQKNTLYNFFNVWIGKDILNEGRYITPLEEAVKAVEIRKVQLASLRELATGAAEMAGLSQKSKEKDNGISNVTRYWVFPEGDLVYNGGSTSDTNIYSITLVIAGTVNSEQADGGLNDTLKNIAKSLGATALLGGVGRILGR